MARSDITDDEYKLIESYVKSLKGGVPWISDSHITLRGLYAWFGKKKIDDITERYWSKKDETPIDA